MTLWDPDDPTPEQLAAIEAIEQAINDCCSGRGWLDDGEFVTEWVACVYTVKATDRPGRGSHMLLGPLSQPVHHEIGLLRVTLAHAEGNDQD